MSVALSSFTSFLYLMILRSDDACCVALVGVGELEESKTESIKVQSKPSGLWWIVGGRTEKEPDDWDKVESKSSITKSQAKDVKDGLPPIPDQRPPPSKFRRSSSRANSYSQDQPPPVPQKPPRRSSSMSVSDASSVASPEPSPGIGTSQIKSWLSRSPSSNSTVTTSQIVEEPKSEGSIWNWKSSPSSTPPASGPNSVASTPAQTPGEGMHFHSVLPTITL